MAAIIHPDAGANSFTDIAFADPFWTQAVSTSYPSFGIQSLTVPEQESWLVQATSALVLLGARVADPASGNLHDLPFPATGLVDFNTGRALDDDSNPINLQKATALYAAFLENKGPNPMDPPSTAGYSEIGVINGLANVKVDTRTLPAVVMLEVTQYLRGLWAISEPYKQSAGFGVVRW